MIDETQDTNHDQYRLIKKMIACGVKTVIVGDKKQSIYKFRGADITAFDEMLSALSDKSTEINISYNFRTENALLSKIQDIFNSRYYYNGRVLAFKNASMEKIDHKELDTKKPLALYYQMDIVKVIGAIKKQCHTGIEIQHDACYYKSIGILCRTNYELNKTAWLLKKSGINAEIVGGKSFYKSKAVIDTFKILNAVIHHGDVEISELKYTDYYLALLKFNKNNKELLDELIKELRFDLRENRISAFLKILYEKTNILEYYKENKQEKANLIKLIDVSRNLYDEGMQPTDFLEYLDIMILSAPDEETTEVYNEGKDSCVFLTTIHRAKGLSFDAVILPNIDANLIRSKSPKVIYDHEQRQLAIDHESIFDMQSGNFQDPAYAEMAREENIASLEEELRVLYVAMTRAKSFLVIGTDKSKEKIHYRISKSDTYASWYRWLYERDNGKLLGQIEK